jgi:hypothetical protein
MGMDSYAVNGYVIPYYELKKICPDEIAAIENERFFKATGWGVIAKWLTDDDVSAFEDEIYFAIEDSDEALVEECVKIYHNHIVNLTKAFQERTGLTLYFDHYDYDGGGRYDNPYDSDGCIFCVNGMTQLTPAGEKYKDIVIEARWTQYG